MEDQLTNNRYTDKEYWEKYYSKNKIEITRINKIVGYYDEFWEKLVNSCKRKPSTIIEIGAYPGRYLAYLSSKYNLIPTALDYNSDTEKIKACFEAYGINQYNLIQADFLQHVPQQQYDLVISNGFVEHFENYNDVLDYHCRYLAPGGALYIMIPNKKHLRKYYSLILDSANLKIHNLKVMNLGVFHRFGERNQLKAEFIGYHGGFNYNVHQELNIIQQWIHKVFRFLFRKLNPVIQKNPNKLFSSTIIAIYSSEAVK